MLANDIPLILEYCYLPEKLFSDILDKNLNSILYKVILEEYGMKLMHSIQEIGAILPSEMERKFLKISNNCACIWAEGIVYNDTGKAVEYTRSIYRGDKYKFKCNIGNYIIEQ
jgi:DNA-binding GntR family transcriptional regulator